ncbi:MAG: 16S rRNA (adenine(1518)-N(6)/adenine(1519)-N(6))-dimethyltransferase RsmA [Myxococcales bacterium]|nr:16S rRNA (adenine(1518)-N(6)/adenine(1519)-N(6))-dimethyltransferase RsmA [Myxococcales bacterium]
MASTPGMDAPSELARARRLLAAHGLRARKALSQNFLVDALIARQIVDLAGVRPGDLVVEIGGGLGVLTRRLVQAGGRVVVVEKDRDLAPLLREDVASPNLEVIEADVLRVDLAALVAERAGPGERAVLVANLPYNISTEVLFRLLDARRAFRRFALMLQREVAERFASPPGSRAYGVPSVLAQVYCDIEIVLHVPPGAFEPVPKVESAFTLFDVLDAPRVPISDERRFRRVVKAAFSQRRKTVANSLKSAFGDRVPGALAAAGIDPMRRAETLTVAEFAALAEGVGGS